MTIFKDHSWDGTTLFRDVFQNRRELIGPMTNYEIFSKLNVAIIKRLIGPKKETNG